MLRKHGQSSSQLRRRERQKKATSFNATLDSHTPSSSQVSVFSDYHLALILVFGGCCSNVCTFESLLRVGPSLGSTITFGQMVFITLQYLPSFLLWDKKLSLPRLAHRQVPLREWLLQVIVLISGNLLNNWAFAYHVPLTLQIVFRSSGLPVSMLLGRILLRRTYGSMQISVLIVSFGVLLATMSNTPSSAMPGKTAVESEKYLIGICMLTVSLLFTGVLGVLQEKTYKKYGPCWKEGVFYTHLLSLPMFTFLLRDLKDGAYLISTSPINIRMMFFANFVTQLVCVSGVNLLASRVSSVSTNLVLTVRKAVSLGLSVYFWGGIWNIQLSLGAALVFSGSFLYSVA